MKKATRAWVKKAEEDYTLALAASKSSVPVHNGTCFHCQQCAEKYLKGLMEELGLSVPKTHNLQMLLIPLASHHPALTSLRRGLIFLSNFAVETHYPGISASKRQAVASLRWVSRIRILIRANLRLK